MHMLTVSNDQSHDHAIVDDVIVRKHKCAAGIVIIDDTYVLASAVNDESCMVTAALKLHFMRRTCRCVLYVS